MNQSVAQIEENIYAQSVNRAHGGEQETLLSRIFERLVRAVNSSARDTRAQNGYQGFIDSNLLDSNLGPEISRTLRQ